MHKKAALIKKWVFLLNLILNLIVLFYFLMIIFLRRQRNEGHNVLLYAGQE